MQAVCNIRLPGGDWDLQTIARVGISCGVDRGQTREICEKQEKYFKGKVVTLPVSC